MKKDGVYLGIVHRDGIPFYLAIPRSTQVEYGLLVNRSGHIRIFRSFSLFKSILKPLKPSNKLELKLLRLLRVSTHSTAYGRKSKTSFRLFNSLVHLFFVLKMGGMKWTSDAP